MGRILAQNAGGNKPHSKAAPARTERNGTEPSKETNKEPKKSLSHARDVPNNPRQPQTGTQNLVFQQTKPTIGTVHRLHTKRNAKQTTNRQATRPRRTPETVQ
mmetsp:Transcript_27975/g.61631  ORF Transcript_27975/g.61631 Transcript_27975/m.61631 type:complete len:103 (+) Transcript_27975:1618-1926(+)